MQDGYAGHRPGLLGEAERAAVEGNALRKARNVDADRNGSAHWFLWRLALAVRPRPVTALGLQRIVGRKHTKVHDSHPGFCMERCW